MKVGDKIKFDDLEFSYIKDGKNKYRDRLWLPFEVGKKSSLKGLKLCVHKSTKSKYEGRMITVCFQYL